MSAHILDGRAVATSIKQSIKHDVAQYTHNFGRAPGLAVILVGADPASRVYVANKIKACHEVGINSYNYELDAKLTQLELIAKIEELNNRNDIDGILVQLPLPKHINENAVITSIDPAKDVDGFHQYNFGKLAQGNPNLRPCTPFGVIQLLEHYRISVAGKNAVVVGASNIVGRPMAFELLQKKATVSVCHRATTNLAHYVSHADIVVVATGNYNAVKAEWLKKHQVIVDVGIHRGADGLLHGDVDFNKAKDRVAWITPVPGGVGPMTIMMLLMNTIKSAEDAY